MKKYDVVCANGEYTTVDGQTKTRWLNCGMVVQTKNGFALKLDCIPTRRNDKGELWFSLFKPKQHDQQRPPAPTMPPPQGATAPDNFRNDDIPF